MATHAIARDKGRNVHCICGAEYSLYTNLNAHIKRENDKEAEDKD